jgi:hypothetical protein
MEVLEAFMDRYFPEKYPLKPVIDIPESELQKFAGEYRVNRFAYNDFTKIASLMGRAQISISGKTKLKTTFGEQVDYWVPIDKLTFRKEHSSDVIEFKAGTDTAIKNLFIGGLPIFALDKVSGIDTSAVHFMILIVSFIFIFLTLIGGPLKFFIRKEYKRELNSARKVPLSARLTSWLAAFCFLVFFVLFMVGLGDPNEIIYGVPLIVKIALAFPLVAILFTLLVWYFVIMIWISRSGDVMDRVSYTSFGIACSLLLWQLNYWNLLGYYY